jgi:DNA invertase Pin-like site-specific DNA recombinase
MTRKAKVQALAYLRTSSAGNVGGDKDSERRQRESIRSFAARSGHEVVDWFADPGVSGADPIESRPGFLALLDRIEGNGIRTILVEDASRFARDLVTQELGIISLVARGVRVITASGDDLTCTDDPFKTAMRQIAGTFAQLEKARLVAKLRAARDRKRALGLKAEGRPSYSEKWPELIGIVRKLRRRRPKGVVRSLRAIAGELRRMGYTNSNGNAFSASAVRSMLMRRVDGVITIGVGAHPTFLRPLMRPVCRSRSYSLSRV